MGIDETINASGPCLTIKQTTYELKVCGDTHTAVRNKNVILYIDSQVLPILVKNVGITDKAVGFLEEYLLDALYPSNTLCISTSGESDTPSMFTVKNGCSGSLRAFDNKNNEIHVINHTPKEYYSFMFDHLRNLMPTAAFNALKRVLPSKHIGHVYQRFETGLTHAYTITSCGSMRINDIKKELMTLVSLASAEGDAAAGFLKDRANDMLYSVSVAACNDYWSPDVPRRFQVSICSRPPTWYERVRYFIKASTSG